MRKRKTNPRTDPRDKARIYDQDAAADWNINCGTAPIRYDPVWSRTGIVANDADPNVTPPADNLIIPAGDDPLGAIGFFVIVTQNTTFQVWRRTGLPAPLAWVRVPIGAAHSVTLGAADSNGERYVETGFGDVFVQVSAGADGGHPVALHVGAA